MHKIALIRISSVLVLLSLGIAACGGSKTQVPIENTPNIPVESTEIPASGNEITSPDENISKPKIGGTLQTTFQTDDPSSLDPSVPIDNAGIFSILQIYDQFFRVSQDSTLEADAVIDYSVSEDGLIYTFELRPELKFADGTLVTMDDVLFSLERFQSSENWGYLLPEGLVFEAIDEHKLQMTLKSPNASLLASLSTAAASIVPKAQVESLGDAFWETPFGSGAFMVEEWVHGEHLTLSRNPYYWDTPKPYVDQVVINLIPDENTRMLNFQAGDLDIALDVPYNMVETIDTRDGASVQVKSILASQNVHLNASIAQLNDLNMRLALQYATDREALVEAVLFGYGEVATTLWPRGLLYWDDTITGYPFNLDLARSYLAKSAYPDGFDIELIYAAGDTAAEQTATLLKDQWSQIGVNVTLQALEGSLHIDNTLSGNFETSIVYWSSDVIDPTQLNISHLCALTEAMVGGCDKTFDTLAAEADILVNPTDRAAAYSKVFREAENWSIYIPLYYFPARTAVWDYVKGFELTPTLYARYCDVWLDK